MGGSNQASTLADLSKLSSHLSRTLTSWIWVDQEILNTLYNQRVKEIVTHHDLFAHIIKHCRCTPETSIGLPSTFQMMEENSKRITFCSSQLGRFILQWAYEWIICGAQFLLALKIFTQINSHTSSFKLIICEPWSSHFFQYFTLTDQSWIHLWS